jgi:hypothetical protein
MVFEEIRHENEDSTNFPQDSVLSRAVINTITALRVSLMFLKKDSLIGVNCYLQHVEGNITPFL